MKQDRQLNPNEDMDSNWFSEPVCTPPEPALAQSHLPESLVQSNHQPSLVQSNHQPSLNHSHYQPPHIQGNEHDSAALNQE